MSCTAAPSRPGRTRLRRRRGRTSGTDPTPCTDWDVRDLVNHVVGEDALDRAADATARTIADVGDRFDGDLLGDDPVDGGTALARGGGRRRSRERLPAGGAGAPVLRRGGAARSTSASSPPTTSCTPGTSPPRPAATRALDPRPRRRGGRPGSPSGRQMYRDGRRHRAARRRVTATRRASCSPRPGGTRRGTPTHAADRRSRRRSGPATWTRSWR